MEAKRGAFEAMVESRYSMAVVVRLTGLSMHVLRAWERRYGAVTPQRTPGGTRRYSRRDVERLRLLRGAVEAGHAISAVAGLSDAELRDLLSDVPRTDRSPIDEIFAALERLDAAELDRQLSMYFAALGPATFARRIALPVLREVGRRWAAGELSVAAEHLTSAGIRSVLGAGMRGRPARGARPALVFATPSGERHEFGALVAALLALGAGTDVVYLGPDLPAGEVCAAALDVGARAVVLGATALPPDALDAYLTSLRDALPPTTEIWLGGHATQGLAAREGVAALPDLDSFETRALAASSAAAAASGG